MEQQQEIQQWIRDCRKGDAKAFANLVAKHQQLVYRLAFRLLGDDDEAKDMTQETFIKVWLGLDRYQEEFRFSTWLYRVTCNVCYDRLRCLAHSPTRSPIELDGISERCMSEEDVEQSFIGRELREWLFRATEALPAKQKLVFVLRELEELEVNEVAYMTGLSALQIKQNLYLAKKTIGHQLKKMDWKEVKHG